MKHLRSPRFILVALIALGFFAYRSYLKRNPQDRSLETDKDFISEVEEIAVSGPLAKSSEYEGNRLMDGNSPFDNVYGRGIYNDTQHSLRVNNRGNRDVVIFLVSVGSERVIRNEYVRAYSSFDMTQIPNSRCYVKYYYGKDWNPTRMTKNVVTGGFDNDEQHIVSNEWNDIFEFREEVRGDYIYSSNYELTLETVVQTGNTMSEERISANDFF